MCQTANITNAAWKRLVELCERENLPMSAMQGRRGTRLVWEKRRKIVSEIYAEFPMISVYGLGKMINRDNTSIENMLATNAKRPQAEVKAA